MDWLETMDTARRAGDPGVVLHFNTGDWMLECDGESTRIAALKWFLAERFAREGCHVGCFSLGQGFEELVPPQTDESRRRSALADLEGEEHPLWTLRRLTPLLRDAARPVALIVDHAEHLAPDAHGNLGNEQAAVLELLWEWSADADLRAAGSFVLLLSREGGLPALLMHESGYRTIGVGLPSEPVRRTFIEQIVASTGTRAPLTDELDESRLARLTGGLRLADIEQLMRDGRALDRALDAERVRERKHAAIGGLCRDLLEVIEPERTFDDVAGCRAAKEYFRAIAPLWREGSRSLPQGVLLSGPPGGGKSFIVNALAGELSTPCVSFRGIREQWVGASERNLERILEVIRQLAPCVVWTDELDQQIGGERSEGPSGDSGVGQRLFGRLLEFFGDSSIRGRVLWIATSNRPDLLDAAVGDRFSVKIPLLHPSRDERAALLPKLAAQVGRRLATGVDCERLAERPELDLLSARALQEVLVWAGTLADMDAGTPDRALEESQLERAIADYRPSADPVTQELMALLSLRMTSFDSLLPWAGLGGYRCGRDRWPSYLDEIVNPATGAIDDDALAERIEQLQAAKRSRGAGA